MAYFSKRLPHVLTRADLATLLTPTYAEARSVDDEEAHDRVTRALKDDELLDALYDSLSEALAAAKGSRTDDDALMDKISTRVEKRKGRMKPAPSTPAISAAVIRIDLSGGIASDTMRAVVESPKGKAALVEGMRALGAHLVKELLK